MKIVFISTLVCFNNLGSLNTDLMLILYIEGKHFNVKTLEMLILVCFHYLGKAFTWVDNLRRESPETIADWPKLKSKLIGRFANITPG